jgi:hypothetical protein
MQHGVVFHVNLCLGRMRIICFFYFFSFVENLFQEMVASPCTDPELKNAEAFFFSFGFENPHYPVVVWSAYDAAELPVQKFSVLFLYG